jgi:2-octaprenylphenol hydroxylase
MGRHHVDLASTRPTQRRCRQAGLADARQLHCLTQEILGCKRYNVSMNSLTSSTASDAMQARCDVCIVGDGAIAKTAALGLAQAGRSVTLLSAPAWAPATSVSPAANSTAAAAAAAAGWDVRVYALNHTAHDLLSALKVWGALDAARVAPVDAMTIFGDGAQAGGLAFDAYGAHVGALAWIVEDRNLNMALDCALRFAQNVHIVHGRATRLESGEAGAVVHLDSGAALAADLVVGADGAHSWVRGQCDIGFDYRSYGQRGVVTNFACELPHHGVAHQWFAGTEGILALLPLPGQQVSLVWSAPHALADTLRSMSPSALAARVSGFCAAQLGALTPLQPELVRDFPLMLVRPHAVTAARVALVGDAAHVVHPMAGQGMNLGFADVVALLDVVARCEPQRSIGDARVLARYARARKEDVLLMQLATDGLARLFGSDVGPLRVARNFGLNLLDNFPLIKRRLIGHALGK